MEGRNAVDELRAAERALEVSRGWVGTEDDRRARALARFALHHVQKWFRIVRGHADHGGR